MKSTYSPQEFGQLIGRKTKTLQKWDREGKQRHNTEIIVMNGEALSPEHELVQDLMAIITVFASRLPGLRSYKKAMKDAALQKD